MRLLLLTPDFPPTTGGVQVLMARLGNALATRSQHTVRVVTLGPGDVDGAGPTVARVGGGGRLGHRTAVARLNAEAVLEGVRFRPDAVISGHIVTAPAARALSRLVGAPYLQWVYGWEMTARPRLLRFAVAAADATLTLSGYTEQTLLALGAHPRRIRRIRAGAEEPLSAAENRGGRPEFVTVSRLAERYKGHDVVIRAMPLIVARVPDARWTVVGDGPLRALYETQAQALGIEKSIEFTGFLSPTALNSTFARAQVHVMPSRLTALGGGEGLGFAFLEAARHGLPVVAGDVGGARDAVVDGVTGVLVDPTDHVALAHAVADLLEDRGRAAAMGEAGRAFVADRTWAACGDDVAKVLVEAVGRGSIRS